MLTFEVDVQTPRELLFEQGFMATNPCFNLIRSLQVPVGAPSVRRLILAEGRELFGISRNFRVYEQIVAESSQYDFCQPWDTLFLPEIFEKLGDGSHWIRLLMRPINPDFGGKIVMGEVGTRYIKLISLERAYAERGWDPDRLWLLVQK